MNGLLALRSLAFACFILACSITFAQAQEANSATPTSQWRLRSREPYQAVHVPFVLREGQIIVSAKLAGKAVECRVDTGYDGITWDSRLDVPCVDTGQISRGWDAAGHQIVSKVCVLPLLQLGDYALQSVRGYCSSPAETGKAAAKAPPLPALLGNLAFKDVVLTIDYQKHELVLRHPDYDMTRQPHQRQALTLGMKIASNAAPSYGVPVVAGSLFEWPIRLLLDTGWTTSEIGVAETLLRPHSALQTQLTASGPPQEVTRNFNGGDANVLRIPSVDFCLGTRQFVATRRAALIFVPTFPAMDAVVGYDILQYFRVTLDYPRQKALLDPYEVDFQTRLNRSGQDLLTTGEAFTSVVVNGKTYTIPKGMTAVIGTDGSVKIVPQSSNDNSDKDSAPH